MEIKVITGDILKVEAGACALGFFERGSLDGELAGADRALDGAISQLISRGEIKGKLGEVSVIHSLGKLPCARVAVIGLGKKKELTLDKVREAVAGVCHHMQQKKVDDIATVLYGAGMVDITPEKSAQAITEGALLGTYSFRKHITGKEDEPGEIKRLSVVIKNKKDVQVLEEACHRGEILSEAVNLARDMVNEPSNFMTPTQMAELALRLAQDYGLASRRSSSSLNIRGRPLMRLT
jgi:leucyl aminopeptidase